MISNNDGSHRRTHSSYFSLFIATFIVYGPFPASNIIHFTYDESLGPPLLGFPSTFPLTTTVIRVCVACSFFTPTVFCIPRFFRSSYTIHRFGQMLSFFVRGVCTVHSPATLTTPKSLYFLFVNILDYRPRNNNNT